MKTKNFLKDKNKLLMIIPIVLGGLFLYVFFVHDTSSKEVAENEKERQSVLLEPDSEAKDKALNKIEAYKQDEREEKEKQRIMDESQVRGSDFYFDLQNRNEKYDQATLEKIRKMRRDPYSDVMGEYGSSDSHLSEQLEKQLASIEDEEELKEIIREARKNAEIRKELEQNNVYRQKIYKRIIGYDQEKKKAENPTEPKPGSAMDSLVSNQPIYIAENGKRTRRQQASMPSSNTLFKACIHGDQTVVTGSTVRMRMLEDAVVCGMKIPANTLFYGVATLGANRLEVVVNNLKVGNTISPVSFVIFDNDAMEGLNLPNNMKAQAAKRMQQGLVQNIDMPLASIGTMTSEITSAVNATTQIAKQILNMKLSQVKVHLKSNYQMYIQEETKESKLKRKAVQEELQRLYAELEENKNNQPHPLETLIDKL
ncbi:conjugative transposon protein TraM [Phocaeicola dorei]|uniref:Conjugative transposon protein TraM n=3 Tax=Bacteria TaxID=2 RepID=A0A6L3IMJ7_9BACT|nr:conjugative transposon protein TraM [Phocaeicola dorei]KAA5287138.1 conjugative transposon protein TraM [Phocaeicola dorei]KAA5298241.1 conjugative transposon protein TraM [Phocaeicola dorei]KAA5305788.1 conjugative transposon protein TraM [Phocaeicola dorei]KAA5306060.1 conjugative transposon protein TraM [Phocaeicola dorei]KAA5315054.1 conjugative transposon protein TraM [Phocaeicola dorei]